MNSSIPHLLDFAAGLLQFVTGILFLHSLIHLFRVYRNIDKWDFFWLVVPIILCTGLAFYNVADTAYVIQRFPINILSGAGMAWSFYRLSKKAKNDVFTIQNVMKREASDVERKVLDIITGKDCKSGAKSVSVSKETLMLLPRNTPEYPCKKTYIIFLNVPQNAGLLCFIVPFEMLLDGEFAEQYHPDLREEIHVHRGCMYNASTGKTYYAGDVIHIPAGEDHHIIAHDRSSGVAYLFDVE